MSRSRLTSAWAASDSLGAVGVAWKRTLSPAADGGETELTPAVDFELGDEGRRRRRGRGRPRIRRRSGSGRRRRPASGTRVRCRPGRRSPSGTASTASVPVSIESSGIARNSRIEVTPITATHGCAMTFRVHRSQKPSCRGRPAIPGRGSEGQSISVSSGPSGSRGDGGIMLGGGLTLTARVWRRGPWAALRLKGRRMKARARATIPPGITRSPRKAIRVGSRVVAVRIETATTVIAPSAIERRAWLSTIQRPARETITARPEKVTARPEVESARSRASSSVRPASRSSR